MFKNLRPAHLFMIAGLLFTAMSSCIKSDYFPCQRPRGEVIQERRTIHPLTQGINLSLHGEVFLTKGETPSLTIIAAENLMEHISIRNSGQDIIIKQDCCIKAQRSDIQIIITLPRLNTLEVSGSGMILVEDAFESETMHLAISGSGSIQGPLSGEELQVGISGSGRVEINGEFYHQRVAISGSGEARNANVLSQEAQVFISGSGNAFVHAAQKIKVVISGSGNTYYYGLPQVSSTISGTGSVIAAN